jgi:hypothetical protein
LQLEGGSFLPWFLQSDNPNWATTAIQSAVEYPLPSDFIRPMEAMVFYFNPNINPVNCSPWKNVIKDTDYEVANDRWGGYSCPKKYYLSPTGIQIFPMSDKAYLMRLRYYKAQPVLSSNIENAWTKWSPDLVAAMTGMEVASKVLKDQELATSFGGDFKLALARLNTMHEARDAADAHWTSGDD